MLPSLCLLPRFQPGLVPQYHPWQQRARAGQQWVEKGIFLRAAGHRPVLVVLLGFPACTSQSCHREVHKAKPQ